MDNIIADLEVINDIISETDSDNNIHGSIIDDLLGITRHISNIKQKIDNMSFLDGTEKRVIAKNIHEREIMKKLFPYYLVLSMTPE